MYKLLIPVLIISIALTGCEKNIDFKLANQEPRLVVEATIENGKPPVVFLSESLNYFSTINIQLLSRSFVHNAAVYISNGTQTHKLKEYTAPLDSGYALYFYSVDTTNLATAFVGSFNTGYSLKINTGNKEYTASTTIPYTTKKIDSIWWKPAPKGVDSNKVVVMTRVTDPPGYGDYVRYYTKWNSGPFYPGINSVFDDLVVDGTTYNIEVEPGFNRNVKREEGDSFFNRGDTVTLKLSNIDKGTFDFWRTMEYSYQSIGNPFSSPTKVLGNISNGALGYFGGYASQYRTLIIPK